MTQNGALAIDSLSRSEAGANQVPGEPRRHSICGQLNNEPHHRILWAIQF